MSANYDSVEMEFSDSSQPGSTGGGGGGGGSKEETTTAASSSRHGRSRSPQQRRRAHSPGRRTGGGGGSSPSRRHRHQHERREERRGQHRHGGGDREHRREHRRRDDSSERDRQRRRHHHRDEPRTSSGRRDEERRSDVTSTRRDASPSFQHKPRRLPPGPDMNKVMERVERLRRQGCTAAYDQIMSGGTMPVLGPQLMHQQQRVAAQLNIPKFYNPNAINIAKIADQERKKKLLWGNKATPTAAASADVPQPRAEAVAPAAAASSQEWKPVAAFDQDADGKMAAKFLRLMGVKDASQTAASCASDAAADTVQKQRQMFNDMEQQYEQARMTTHTQRGFGLGYTPHYYLPKS